MSTQSPERITRSTPSAEALAQPSARSALLLTVILVAGYFTLSILTFVVIVLLRNDPAMVNIAVWIRGTIVAATAAFLFFAALSAKRGSRRAYLRVRIVSAVVLAAIVVIIALPGTFPLWMKLEQGVCGLLLLGVVLVVNGKPLRSLFAAKPAE